jgi:hypothetical protein
MGGKDEDVGHDRTPWRTVAPRLPAVMQFNDNPDAAVAPPPGSLVREDMARTVLAALPMACTVIPDRKEAPAPAPETLFGRRGVVQQRAEAPDATGDRHAAMAGQGQPRTDGSERR